MAKGANRFLDTLLGAAARVLAPWLQALLVRIEQARRNGAAAADTAEATGQMGGSDPLAKTEIPINTVSGGPPAHWLEKVRRGAPHLLRPAGQRAVKQTAARATSSPLAATVAPASTSSEEAPAVQPAVASEIETPPASLPQRTQRVEPRAARLLPPSRAEAKAVTEKAPLAAQTKRGMALAREPESIIKPALSLSSASPPVSPPAPELELVAVGEVRSPATQQARPLPPMPAAPRVPEKPAQCFKENGALPPPARTASATETTSTQPLRSVASRHETPRDFARGDETSHDSIEKAHRRVEPGLEKFVIHHTPSPRPVEPSPPASPQKDRWPALPPAPEPNPVDDALAFWREEERRRYLAAEQEGIYGPHRVSHRG